MANALGILSEVRTRSATMVAEVMLYRAVYLSHFTLLGAGTCYSSNSGADDKHADACASGVVGVPLHLARVIGGAAVRAVGALVDRAVYRRVGEGSRAN